MSELQPILDKLPPGVAHWITGLVVWMGLARLVAKFFSGWLQGRLTAALADAAKDAKGAAAVHAVLDSHPYRVLAFLLDWTCSIKLPCHVDFHALTAEKTGTGTKVVPPTETKDKDKP